MKEVKIIVATHKKYKMPRDKMYVPVHVGSEGKEEIKGYQRDNEGDNISNKNPYYCELTAMYWAWKNLKSEYIGLAHYRRHFTCAKRIPKEEEKKFEKLLTKEQIEDILKDTDIVLPKKRNYYIDTVYEHYAHTLHVETLDETKKILEEMHHDYLEIFEKNMKKTSAHMFNMFIMRKEYFDQYCEWLFSILFELERRINPSQYDSFHARYLGRISELLLDVWIDKNNLKYKEIRVVDMQNVNWIKKGMAFLKAKFVGKKYNKSF